MRGLNFIWDFFVLLSLKYIVRHNIDLIFSNVLTAFSAYAPFWLSIRSQSRKTLNI